MSSALQIKTILSTYYALGHLQDIRKLPLGYVNTSYVVDTEKHGRKTRFILRKYRTGLGADEIDFEHAVLGHLVKQNFPLVAGPVLTTDGRSYVEAYDDRRKKRYYALFPYLPGEDRYAWDNPACDQAELRSAARVLAQYHAAVYGLTPAGRRSEPRIVGFLPIMARNLERHATQIKGTAFDAYFKQHLGAMQAHIEALRQGIDTEVYRTVVHLPIHGDYHPGNVKFQQRRVTGLFDFDWSKIDARCFDVALALVYFCAVWDGRQDGVFQVPKARQFLRAYQGVFGKTDRLGPMQEIELELLPSMLQAANLYVLHWAINDYYRQTVDPDTYLGYVHHGIQLMRWLDQTRNLQALAVPLASTRNRIEET